MAKEKPIFSKEELGEPVKGGSHRKGVIRCSHPTCKGHKSKNMVCVQLGKS